MADVIFRDLSQKLGNKVRPFRTRPDNTHISLENIEELRKLIQAGSSQKGTEACSRCVRDGPSGVAFLRAADAHAAKFEHPKELAIHPHALLHEKHGTGRAELHAYRDCH